MHEAALALTLIEAVADDALARGIQGVEVLEIRVGEWSGVNPEALRFAFAMLRRGTVCEHALLEVDCVTEGDELIIVAYEGRPGDCP